MALDICLEVLEIFILPRNLCDKYGVKASSEAETLWMVPIDDLGGFLWWPAAWGPFSPEPCGFLGLCCSLWPSLRASWVTHAAP